jgi:hypothetical protein
VVEVLVGLCNLAVAVAIDILTLDGIAVLVVDLLVYIGIFS